MCTYVLDVLTPLSDCRQEPVEKVERRISGVSYMYWMDFYNVISCCGFLCARLISVSFSASLFRLPRSKQTSGYRRVITPAGRFSLFFLSSANTSVSPSTATTFPPSLAHTARTHSTYTTEYICTSIYIYAHSGIYSTNT